MATPPDPANRIITHMNKDHTDSITRYLEHYCGVSSFKAQYGKLTAFSCSFMTIKALGSTYRVPFDPPLKDYSEARPRVVTMDYEAIEGLGRDTITLNSYTLPRKPWQISIFGLVVCTVLLLGRRDTLAPGPRSLLRPLATKFPALFPWLWKIQPLVLLFMLVMHTGEAMWMARSRLRKHSVPVFSRLWFKWVASTFIEGFGSFMRLDEMVEEERVRREKKGH